MMMRTEGRLIGVCIFETRTSLVLQHFMLDTALQKKNLNTQTPEHH